MVRFSMTDSPGPLPEPPNPSGPLPSALYLSWPPRRLMPAATWCWTVKPGRHASSPNVEGLLSWPDSAQRSSLAKESVSAISASTGGRGHRLERRHHESHLLDQGMAENRQDAGHHGDAVAYGGVKTGRAALTRYFLRSASIAASCRSILRRSRSRSAAAFSVRLFRPLR